MPDPGTNALLHALCPQARRWHSILFLPRKSLKGFLTHEATSSSRAESLLTKARHSREAVGALRTGSRPSLAQKPPLVPASLTWQVQVLTLVYEAL